MAEIEQKITEAVPQEEPASSEKNLLPANGKDLLLYIVGVLAYISLRVLSPEFIFKNLIFSPH